MICKWCGAAMERSQTVCRRCGKEAPVLSDCGGFYDLVPQARQAIPVAAVETGSAQPAKKSGLLGFLCVLLAILLAVSVIVCAVTASEKKELAEELEELEELLDEPIPMETIGKNQPGETTQTENQETTAETGTGDPAAEPIPDTEE